MTQLYEFLFFYSILPLWLKCSEGVLILYFNNNKGLEINDAVHVRAKEVCGHTTAKQGNSKGIKGMHKCQNEKKNKKYA